jgi:hypothetical protein
LGIAAESGLENSMILWPGSIQIEAFAVGCDFCPAPSLRARSHIEYVTIDPVTASARLQVLPLLPHRYQNAPQSSNLPSQRAQIPPFLNVSSFEHGFCRADWCEIGAEISGIRTYFQVS